MLSYEFIDPEAQITSDDFSLIESFLIETNRTQIGWHYFTDISWIYRKAKNWPRSWKILDAGGGMGPLQYFLAEMGFTMVNIDMNLDQSPPLLTKRYSTTLKQLPSYQPTGYKNHLNNLKSQQKTSFTNFIRNTRYFQKYLFKKYCRKHEIWRDRTGGWSDPVGAIHLIVGNLCRMPEIETGYFDAVVSLSALEHIPKNQLTDALSEIKRVLKPDAKWAVTTSGTDKKNTWFHDPSKGYCFSKSDLKEIFKADNPLKQNPEEVLLKYKQNVFLKNNIAGFYFKSGDNGMPWGKWEPQYIPVGIFN